MPSCLHVCQSVCFGLYKAYAHSDCCEAMHDVSESVFCYVQDICSQSLLQDDTCMCVYVRACVSMFLCMCMNKAYANTVTPARLCMHVCECMNKAYVDTKLFMFTHICVCMNKAYAHCHCCEAMHVCVYVCMCVQECIQGLA